MNRTVFLTGVASAMAASGFATSARAAVESDASLVTASGALFGTLRLPSASGRVPVVLIIAGSGPTDRDGNNPLIGGKSDTYRLLAQGLAARGFASLRYDKRGIGASAAAAPSQEELRFEMYVADAAGWQSKLHADPRFGRVLIAGHSEGSLIGMLSARLAAADAFVSLEGAGRRGSVVLLEQLHKQLTPEMYAQAQTIVNALQNGQTATVPAAWPAPLQSLFSPTIQPYLISWFRYDPTQEIAALRVPVTIVQGTADVQVTMTDAKALKAATPGAKLVVVEGMNHVLRHAPDTSSMQAVLKGYEDPTLPIEPDVLNALASA